MSLKRRNTIALVLLLLASVLWTFGFQMLRRLPGGRDIESTMVTTYPMTQEATAEASAISSSPYAETIPGTGNSAPPYGNKFLGIILCFAAVASAGSAILIFRQAAPILGPDGVSMTAAVISVILYTLQNRDYIMWTSVFNTLAAYRNFFISFAAAFCLRELWGWAGAVFSLSWCLIARAGRRLSKPWLCLFTYVLWIMLAVTGVGCQLLRFAQYGILQFFSLWGFLAAAAFGFLCLGRYGADLEHFTEQLTSFQQGLPIKIRDGAFAQTEAQLLDVQASHAEAIHAAVTSERFKVELISNVSHDLRTPLTAILGYSELLQKETLSPQGQEQLRRLHQKAGYMGDLVESLFELTKVSSGVLEAKKEKIDLIRLLEQTIGLMDDQLASAGLTLRRSYPSDSIAVIMDGARLHQIMANLLENAIKYALSGTRIYLEVRKTSFGFRIRLTNTASYEMDFQPDEIMQRFARGDKSRSTKGSGLGLAIAQTYTESLDGTFRVAVDGDQFSAIVELPETERDL